MEYLALLLSSVGIKFACRYKNMNEKYFKLKLFCYWFVTIITTTISGSIPIPIGVAAAFIIYFNAKLNKRAKLYVINSGILGYLLSLLIFILSH